MTDLSYDPLRRHLYEVHRNETALDLSDTEAQGQHHYEHHGPGGLRLHAHDDQIPPTATEAGGQPKAAAEGPAADNITLTGEIGRTRATVTLTSGVAVTGAWAAGDSQALRRLVEALVEVADGATARVDRAARVISDMTTGARILRDQLREALDDIEELRANREEVHIEGSRELARLTHELTGLRVELTTTKYDLAQALATPTVSPDMARILVERDDAKRAHATEKRRADALLARTEELTAVFELHAHIDHNNRDEIRQLAYSAACDADEMIREEKWKEGARYLKLANTWIALLVADGFLTPPPPPETAVE